jgi:hypothetical protein
MVVEKTGNRVERVGNLIKAERLVSACRQSHQTSAQSRSVGALDDPMTMCTGRCKRLLPSNNKEYIHRTVR